MAEYTQDANPVFQHVLSSEYPTPGLQPRPMPEPAPAPQEPEVLEDPVARLNASLELNNIADGLDEELLTRIGTKVVEEYEIDKKSREGWEQQDKVNMEIARQVIEEKLYAGEQTSNVKYPGLSQAVIQFAARAYPNIVKGADVVKYKVVGKDPDGSKQRRADRLSRHQSFQVLHEMEDWEGGMDQLLHSYPITGVYFKKTYRDPVTERNCSDILPGKDLVVNYYAKSFEPRCTQEIELYPNEIEERHRNGTFLKIDYGRPQSGTGEDGYDPMDDSAPHEFLEQHRWWDLDDDGYQEPYVVTVHKDTQKVVRITARWDTDGVHVDDAGEILRIEPVQYFTRFQFMPAFDGGFYGMGFGALVSPLNATINATLNQLLDAGKRANRDRGFIGKEAQLHGRDKSLKFKSDEWKHVDYKGDDIRKALVPLNAKEPSPTLFNLMEFMIGATKELTNPDILAGDKLQSNAPVGTTLALIEQALKVFGSIYKRLHRALKEEFKKIRRLNRLYLEDEEYQRVLDDPEGAYAKQDYGDIDLDVSPVSDAQDLTDMQRLMKAEALMGLRGQGLDDMEIVRRYLDALNIDEVDSLFPESPPPNPEVEFRQKELQLKEMELQLKARELDIKEMEAQERIIKTRADTINTMADAEAKEQGPQLDYYRGKVDELASMLRDLYAELQRVEQGQQPATQTKEEHYESGPDYEGGLPPVATQPGNEMGNEALARGEAGLEGLPREWQNP